jgi:hypothetical protein
MGRRWILTFLLGVVLVLPGCSREIEKPTESTEKPTEVVEEPGEVVEEAAEVDVLEEDLRKLQGSWTCTFRDRDGKVILRKVKKITNNTEHVTWLAADGSILQTNTVEFTLVRRGNDKVYNYFGGLTGEGPAPGLPFKSGWYKYTLEDDTWTEIGPTGKRFVWKRVKEEG